MGSNSCTASLAQMFHREAMMWTSYDSWYVSMGGFVYSTANGRPVTAVSYRRDWRPVCVLECFSRWLEAGVGNDAGVYLPVVYYAVAFVDNKDFDRPSVLCASQLAVEVKEFAVRQTASA